MKWIDVTVPLRTGMVVYPGDPPVAVTPFKSPDKGDTTTLSLLTMGAHSGTHVDGPLHFLPGRAGIDRIPLDMLVGNVTVIAVEDPVSIGAGEIERYDIAAGDRIFFKTRNSGLWERQEFATDYVHLSTEAARLLVSRRVSLVGIDYLSIGGYKGNSKEVHRTLLEASIWIVEGLDLRGVNAGRYHMICLPLLVEGAEGAPARVLLSPL